MTNIQLPRATLDKLLELEGGETGYVIMPIAKNIEFMQEGNGYISFIIKESATASLESVGIFSSEKIALSYIKKKHSPLQQGEKFYVSEEFYQEKLDKESFENYTKGNRQIILYRQDGYRQYIVAAEDWKSANQMQPHQSRFHGTCLGVEVVEVSALECKQIEVEYFEAAIAQHNKLHNTNITPSMNDFIFLLEIRRDK